MINRHHGQFPRNQHDSMTTSRRIRADYRLIFPIDAQVHNELHRNVSLVPVLSHHLGMRAYTLFNDYGDMADPIANIENWQRSIEEAKRHERADVLERHIADLAIFAYDLQKPFIEEGTVSYERSA